MRISSVYRSILPVLILCMLPMFSGCGASSDGKPQSIATEEQVNKIVEMRKLFDKAGGKWEDLSAADKDAYTKLAGDGEKAQAMWKTMSTPMGASPSG